MKKGPIAKRPLSTLYVIRSDKFSPVVYLVSDMAV